MEFVKGYCLALDMTSTSVLKRHKEMGLSWDIGKGLDTFLPLSGFVPKEIVNDPHDLDLELRVGEELRQSGNTKDLCIKIPEIIEYISAMFTLNEGDLILTGTPIGASPMQKGDFMKGKMIQKGKVLMEISAFVENQ